MSILVSPHSQLSASDLVRILHENRRVPEYLRDAIEVSTSTSIIVTNPLTGELPPAAVVPDWFLELHMASFMNEWLITTGEMRMTGVGPSATSVLIPDTGGDASYDRHAYVGWRLTEVHDRADETMAYGHTYPSDAMRRRAIAAGAGSRFNGAAVAEAESGQNLSVTVPMVSGISGGRGLIVVANRITVQGRTIRLPNSMIVNALLHELGIHAGPFSNPESVSPLHGSAEADRRAQQIDILVPPLSDRLEPRRRTHAAPQR
jgi:hypothetical protein